MRNGNIEQTASKGNNPINQAISDIANYYNRPLKKALHRLNKTHKDSYQTIADTVFDGEVTKQNIFQRFFKGEKNG